MSKSWIKNNKNKIFLIDIYSPNHVYLFQKDSGKLAGVYIEFFEKLEQETGLKFKVQSTDKNHMKNLLKNGEGDILFNIAKTPEREKYYFFVPTYNTYNVGLFSKKNKSLDFNNINNLKLGYIEGTSDSILVKEFYPEFKNLISIEDNGNFGFSSLETDKTDAIIGKSSNDVFKSYNFTPLENIPSSQLWLVVNKKYPLLADIIEKLFNTFLIEKSGNDIHVTNKGKQLLKLVPQDLKEPELTAKWEMELAKIAKKEQKSNIFINEIKKYTRSLIDEISSSEAKFKHDNLTTKKCPECNHFMLEVNGKKGKMLVCSNPDCKHRESVSIITNARCPNCHKKLELVGKGDKQMFVCKTCGYRQHMNAFKKERENKNKLARKSDVKKYMNQQKQQQTAVEDSPFAALLKLKDELK